MRASMPIFELSTATAIPGLPEKSSRMTPVGPGIGAEYEPDIAWRAVA